MPSIKLFLAFLIVAVLSSANGFAIIRASARMKRNNKNILTSRYMSSNEQNKIEVITMTVEEVEEEVEEIPEPAPVDDIPEDESAEDKYKREKLAEIAERKSKEVFVTQSTGKFECQACGYMYSEAQGYEKKGIAPGTPFAEIEKFRCPECGANKKYFVAETETISGFQENLNYGFGTNQMTGGQKSNLIFGGLALGFMLFMSGYLLE